MPTYHELKHASEDGDADAMFKLGEMYYHGYGIDKDIEEAAIWYRKALKEGYIPEMSAEKAEEVFGDYESPAYTPAEVVDAVVSHVALSALEVAVRFIVAGLLLLFLTWKLGAVGFVMGILVGLVIVLAVFTSRVS